MSKRITDNTYYKNEIYIPHAKPSVTSDVTTVSAELDAFIEEYERDCLIKCLGFQLFKLFYDELDNSETNGLLATADAKWNDLLNGKDYTNSQGDLVSWRGIRWKAMSTDTLYSRSFLANYVFYNYEQNADVFRTGVGYVKGQAKNAEERSPAPRVINAWRKMVDVIQGKEKVVTVLNHQYHHLNRHGLALDYYYDNSEITLYRFIRDMNLAVDETYPDFKPQYWNAYKNQFGI
jgi:hypothetical protein